MPGSQPTSQQTSTTASFLDDALQLAAHGFRVVPLHVVQEGRCSCGRPACTKSGCDDEAHCHSAGKHPRFNGWQEAATTDGGQLHRWFGAAHKDGNLGVLTGHGLLVLDLDGPKAQEWGERMVDEHGPLPRTWTAKTGRGQHRWFRVPAGVHVRSRTGKAAIAPQVECKGEGGYVVAPPSLHVSGRRYEWKAGLSPAELPQGPAEAPEWLLTLCLEEKASRNGHAPAAKASSAPGVPTAVKGERNSYLAAFAGRLRGLGFEDDRLERAVLEENRLRCDPPLSTEEVRGTVLKSAREWTGGQLAQDVAFQAKRESRREQAKADRQTQKPDHLRVVLTNPRTWYLRWPERGELPLTTEQLDTWPKVKRAHMDHFLSLPTWKPRDAADWQEVLTELLDDVETQEAPEEFTTSGKIVSFVRRFLRQSTDRPDAIQRGGIWYDDHRGIYVFKPTDLAAAIDRDPAFRFQAGCTAREVNEVIREQLGGKIRAERIGQGRDAPQVRAMIVPADRLEDGE